DFLVGLSGEGLQLGLRQARILDPHLDAQTKAATLARADRHGTGDLSLARVLLVLLGDEVERAPVAGRIPCCEQVLRSGGVGAAGAPHLLRHRKVCLDDSVARLRVTVAAARGRCCRCEECFDLVHLIPLEDPYQGRYGSAIWGPCPGGSSPKK